MAIKKGFNYWLMAVPVVLGAGYFWLRNRTPKTGFTLKVINAPVGATQWAFDLGAISFDPAIQPFLPQGTLGVTEAFTFDTTVPEGALMHLFVGSDTIILAEGFNMPVENKKAYVFDCSTSLLGG
jgi:hypothetical protein